MEEQEGIGIEKQQEKMEEEKEKEEGNNAPKMGFAKWVAVRRKSLLAMWNVSFLQNRYVDYPLVSSLPLPLPLHFFPLFVMEVSLSWRS
jgi:hypothetical protein